jgi:class 3 adenylate cyclase
MVDVMSAAEQGLARTDPGRSPMKRKIAAILAADAAEYSRLVAENEEEALRQLVASVEVFRASITAHGGRVFNTAGDAVLAEFQSAVEAVRSALDIQGRLSERNKRYAPDRRMLFRMGISIGDVVENEGDLLGDGVNIAARLQTLSQPGGLAISRWVQEQVAGKVPTEFRDAGYQSVKNMPAPIHVFQSVVPAEKTVAERATAAAKPPLSQTASAKPAAAKPAAAKPTSAGATAARPATAKKARSPVLMAFLAGWAVLLSAVTVLYMLYAYRSGDVAVETPPAELTRPETVPTVARQEPEPQPPAEQEVLQKPEPQETLVPQAAPSETETAAPLPLAPAPFAATPPEAETPPAQQPPAAETYAAPLPSVPATAPIASQPQSQPVSPNVFAPSPPVIAQDAEPARKPIGKQCAEILERAQLGDLTADDRAFLRRNCR